MNLREIREYIANITDYDPNVNKDYSAQVDNVINETYRMLFSEKPFTFAQKEVKIPIYTDASYTASGVYNPSLKLTVVTVTTAFPDWIEGNIVEIEGVEYECLYKHSAANIFYISQSVPTFTSQTIKFKQRYIRLPKDCVSILQVGKRSMSISPTAVGRYIPLTRYEDEYYNLPLDEVNIPNYWIMQDSDYVSPPVVAPTATVTTTSAGQGDRSIRLAYTFVKYSKTGQQSELESGLSPFSDVITLNNTQRLTLTSNVTMLAAMVELGYGRRFYIKNAAATPQFEAIHQIGDLRDPDWAVTYNIDFTQTEFDTGAFVLNNPRYTYTDGYVQRIRLYPRQSTDYELSVRYIYRPARLQEDTDTPDLPQSHHLVLAYGSLMDIFNKHDNAQMSRIYRAKYLEEIIKLEQRFLTQKPRRWVKGYMQESGVDTVPMWTPLKRL
tara:strand:+ start:776 stop:2092 length:1317 start_codon:yes stop_codon:yes gene_type:complete